MSSWSPRCAQHDVHGRLAALLADSKRNSSLTLCSHAFLQVIALGSIVKKHLIMGGDVSVSNAKKCTVGGRYLPEMLLPGSCVRRRIHFDCFQDNCVASLCLFVSRSPSLPARCILVRLHACSVHSPDGMVTCEIWRQQPSKANSVHGRLFAGSLFKSCALRLAVLLEPSPVCSSSACIRH
jgi:hypothetical protein